MRHLKKIYLIWWMGWICFSAIAALDLVILQGIDLVESLTNPEIAQQCITVGFGLSTYMTLELALLGGGIYVLYKALRWIIRRK